MKAAGETLVNPRTGGALLRIDWTWPGAAPPPPLHAHPTLEETFAVTAGRMGVRVRDRVRTLSPGEAIVVAPGTPHRFWNAGAGALRFVQEVRPAGRHQELFERQVRLATEGKLTRRGLPWSPLEAARLWELMEGYLVGPPIWAQRLLLGTLARLARLAAAGRST